jgi:hypothetical protein
MPRVLDHIGELELSDEQCGLHFNELRTLGYLSDGLHWLALNVAEIEQKHLEQIDPNIETFSFGNVPGMEWIPLGMLACSFHWYAVSACNYTRLVGWLVNSGNTAKAAEYVRTVIPEVYVWRNKVAAHFAITDPRSEDSPADLAASVLFPIAFQDDSFVASPFTLGKGGPTGSSTSRSDMTWSLSHTHLDLCKRFWPDRLTA